MGPCLQIRAGGGAKQPKAKLEAAHKAASKIHSASRARPARPRRCKVGLLLARPSTNPGGKQQEADQLYRKLPKRPSQQHGNPSLWLWPCSAMSPARTQAALNLLAEARKRLPDPQASPAGSGGGLLGTGPLCERPPMGQAPGRHHPADPGIWGPLAPGPPAPLRARVDSNRRDGGVFEPLTAAKHVQFKLKLGIGGVDDPLFLGRAVIGRKLRCFAASWPLPVPNPKPSAPAGDRRERNAEQGQRRLRAMQRGHGETGGSYGAMLQGFANGSDRSRHAPSPPGT